MATAEAAPFAKVGGLADVLSSLPPAIKKLGPDVRLIMPLYGSIDPKKHDLKRVMRDKAVRSGRLDIACSVWQGKLPGSDVVVYFLEAPDYFRFQSVYVNNDNSERFLFFSLATLSLLNDIGFHPDIIHCHDFHTALIPDLIKAKGIPGLEKIKTIYTIHNFSYQGKTTPQVLSTGNLNPESLKTLSKDAQNGDINFMVQGILNADLVSTVSPSYAQEIKTEIYGAGLERIIKKRSDDLFGILNGIDIDSYDPATDKYLVKNFSANELKGKISCRSALEKELGLKPDRKRPIVAIISRLTWQKGLDLITERFAELDCYFVILGEGEKKYEDTLRILADRHPDRIAFVSQFDEALARRIYAACDIFMMPSRFEPCGLGQMIAMRYGAVPLVRSTGGLRDTVINTEFERQAGGFVFNNLEQANGFTFEKIDSEALLQTLETAIDVYFSQTKDWKKLMRNCMLKDFSWDRSALEYLSLYEKVLKKD